MTPEELLNLDLSKLKPPPVGEENVPEVKILTERDLFTTELDTSYWLNGSYPSHEDLLRKFGPQYVDWVDTNLEKALKARGLPSFSVYRDPNEIDPHFALACNLVCDYNDKRTLAAKLKEVGLTTKKWQALLRVRKNLEYFKTRVNAIFTDEMDSVAKQGLIQSLAAGDLNAVKYYNEMTGIYRPGSENADLIKMLVIILMEILAQHVESSKLLVIADAMEQHPQLKELMK